MNIDSETLWGGIQDIGIETGDVASDLIAELVRRKLVVVIEGRPSLTEYGWKAYTVLESGDGNIPEVDG